MPMALLQPDLFGGETRVVGTASSPYMNFRLHNNYRKADPDSPSCRTCRWSFRQNGGSKNYAKCGLMGASHSTATDISFKFTCNKWEEDK